MSDSTINEQVLEEDVMILAEEEEIEIAEGQKQKRMCFRGTFSKANELNANKRVYPKEVLRAVYTEAMERSKKSQKPIFGELEHACYTYNDFEVLTKDGYKSYAALNVGDEVASLRYDGKVEYKKVSATINEPYIGKVYHIVGKGIDSTVTPNHKMYLLGEGKILVVTIEEIFDSPDDYMEYELMKLKDDKAEGFLSIKDIVIMEEEYKGNIYCVTVSENHNFFIKDKGNEYLTGNSDSHINLERIAVTFPEFIWDEETGTIKGKAVPTLTEAGKTVSGLAKSGFPICFSTRMAGKVKPLTEDRKRELNITEDVQNCVEVLPGARLISVDVVGDPSCREAIGKTVMEQKETEEAPKPKNPTFKEIFDMSF